MMFEILARLNVEADTEIDAARRVIVMLKDAGVENLTLNEVEVPIGTGFTG